MGSRLEVDQREPAHGSAVFLLVVFPPIFNGSALFSAQLDPMLVLMASGVGLAAAAAIPARSAARMDPVQAIRA